MTIIQRACLQEYNNKARPKNRYTWGWKQSYYVVMEHTESRSQKKHVVVFHGALPFQVDAGVP